MWSLAEEVRDVGQRYSCKEARRPLRQPPSTLTVMPKIKQSSRGSHVSDELARAKGLLRLTVRPGAKSERDRKKESVESTNSSLSIPSDQLRGSSIDPAQSTRGTCIGSRDNALRERRWLSSPAKPRTIQWRMLWMVMELLKWSNGCHARHTQRFHYICLPDNPDNLFFGFPNDKICPLCFKTLLP